MRFHQASVWSAARQPRPGRQDACAECTRKFAALVCVASTHERHAQGPRRLRGQPPRFWAPQPPRHPPSSGGSDASPGEYPSVAEVTFGPVPLHRHARDPRLGAERGPLRQRHGRRGRLAGRLAAAADQRAHRRREPERRRAALRQPGRRAPELPAHVRLRHLAAQAVAELDDGADAGGRRGRAEHLDGRARSRRSSAGGRPRRAATCRTTSRRRACRSPPTRTARAPTATSTRGRWSAPASRRAASTPARAIRAARCSARRQRARCAWSARRASARAARARAGRACTARVADDTLRPWIAETTGSEGVSTATSRASRKAKIRRARRRAAERRWARTHHRAASSAIAPSLEHERDQQDDQDDQQDRSDTDVHGTPFLGPGSQPGCFPICGAP